MARIILSDLCYWRWRWSPHTTKKPVRSRGGDKTFLSLPRVTYDAAAFRFIRVWRIRCQCLRRGRGLSAFLPRIPRRASCIVRSIERPETAFLLYSGDSHGNDPPVNP